MGNMLKDAAFMMTLKIIRIAQKNLELIRVLSQMFPVKPLVMYFFRRNHIQSDLSKPERFYSGILNN